MEGCSGKFYYDYATQCSVNVGWRHCSLEPLWRPVRDATVRLGRRHLSWPFGPNVDTVSRTGDAGVPLSCVAHVALVHRTAAPRHAHGRGEFGGGRVKPGRESRLLRRGWELQVGEIRRLLVADGGGGGGGS